MSLLVGSSRAAAQSVFVVSTSSGQVVCGAKGTSWIPGLLSRRTDLSTFRSLEKVIAGQRLKLKRATGRTRASIRSAISRNEARLRRQRPICRKGPPNQPTPTPIQSPAPKVFDSGGNVTEYGRSLLEIPAGLTASISGGRGIFQNNCVGCHIERTNRTFQNLRTNIARSPMFFDSVSMPDSSLAELTAYLNRFRE